MFCRFFVNGYLLYLYLFVYVIGGFKIRTSLIANRKGYHSMENCELLHKASTHTWCAMFFEVCVNCMEMSVRDYCNHSTSQFSDMACADEHCWIIYQIPDAYKLLL